MSATDLPYSQGQFDVIIQSTAFTSVLDPLVKKQMASEMLRVLKKDGIILWYDYHVNNPWNPDVRGIRKKEITQLFQNCHYDLSRLTLAPPLVRLLAPHSVIGCAMLEKLKFLNTHYLGVIKKRKEFVEKSN